MENKSFSFSRLDTFIQCPRRYQLKYVEGHKEDNGSLATEIGTCLHRAYEIKSLDVIDGKKPNYDTIRSEVEAELQALKVKYGEKAFNEVCKKSGMNYNQKLDIFFENFTKDLKGDWKPLATEMKFEIPFGEYLLNGSIDAIFTNSEGELAIADYKTSKAVYDSNKLKTPLQLIIYGMATEYLLKIRPKFLMYVFILLGKTQVVTDVGVYERGKTKLKRVFEELEECEKTGIYEANGSPLCYFCSFCKNNPNAPESTKKLCKEHSSWRPRK